MTQEYEYDEEGAWDEALYGDEMDEDVQEAQVLMAKQSEINQKIETIKIEY